MIFNHCSDKKIGLMVKSQVCSRKVSVQESMHARGVHDKQSKITQAPRKYWYNRANRNQRTVLLSFDSWRFDSNHHILGY